MATTVIAISLSIIALISLGAIFLFFVAAKSTRHPSYNDILDREEADKQRWTEILKPIVKAAVDEAIAREFRERSRL
jgi:hypothetical protein